MRIALLTSEFPPFNGGVGTYAFELASAASAAGHSVTVLAPNYNGQQSQFDAPLPFTVIRFPGGVANASGLWTRIKATRRLLREKFDIVHAIDWPFFIPARLFAPKTSRVILTVHGTEIIYMKEPKRALPLSWLGFWKSGWATWVGNSDYTTGLLLKMFPSIDKAATRSIPLGVSESWRNRRVSREQARAMLGLAPETLLVVSLGRVIPRKGHLDLASALDRLAPEIAARVQWWIIGPLNEPDYAETIRAAIVKSHVDTTLWGSLSVDDVALRMSAADLFCLPGYQDRNGRVEGFGLVFLEAAAFGVPAIATISGGIPEAVHDGQTGLLVAERDIEALTQALVCVLGNDAFRLRLARQADACAQAKTWARVMEQTYAE